MKQANRTLIQRIFCILLGLSCLLTSGASALAAENDGLDGLNAGAAVYLGGVIDFSAQADGQAKDKTDTEDTDSNSADEAALEEQVQTDTLVMANVNDSVNVRQEADEEAQAVGKLFKNCGGEILERANGWTKLKSGNLEGWAKDDYLLFGEEAAALRETAGSLKATVATDALRVRKEADGEAGVYGLVKTGDTLEVIEQGDEWVTVQYDEDTVGYVSAEYVTVDYIVPTGKTSKEIAEEEREKELAKLSKNQGAVPTSVSDVQLLAALIQCEAGSQPYEGQLAVGAAVMNRVRSGGYPNSIIGVITAPGQFPPATNGKVASVAASGPKASCMQAAQAAVDGATNIGGATHFNRVGTHDGIIVGSHVFW
ncbi:MAG: cell wall hydrolase [Lachnospiraceae bacterium]|nr:cell wall hydrolase [Lachnospiraceae bacterium]